MELFNHVFNTWLLAVLLMPFIQIVNIGFTHESLELMLIFTLAGLLFSIPSFLLCLLSFSWIVTLLVPVKGRFVYWCIAAITSVVMGLYFIFFLLFGEGSLMDGITLTWPGIAATLLSVIIRYRQFASFFGSKETYDETIVS
jgi:hypothetical protein